MIDITIQETVNDVEITVNQTVITVNVTRTTGGGGGGVESVTGDLVNNTDPLNPIINTPSFAETLAEDNKTNDIPIVSNNGKAVVDVNDDYLYISYEGNYLTLEPTNGLQLFSDTNVFTNAPIMVAVIDGEISYTCSSFLLNGEEVATQDWVTSQGYGTGTPSTLISTDADNALVLGTDSKLFVAESTGGGIESVTGTNVDNTDPLNPVVEAPNLAQVLAIDNKTNDIPIFSNNGKAVVDVNDDYASLGYGPQSFAMTDTEVQLYSEVPVTFDSTVSTDFNTPVLRYNTEEVATQPYADAKVADNLTASTTVAPSKTAVNTALDLKVDETSWVDYSATSTIVGWSSFTTKKISYKIIDNAMILDFDLLGTSNTTTASFTIPFNATSTSFSLSAHVVSAGNAQLYSGRIYTVAGSNVVAIQLNGQSTPFNNYGTKRCSGQIIIQLYQT